MCLRARIAWLPLYGHWWRRMQSRITCILRQHHALRALAVVRISSSLPARNRSSGRCPSRRSFGLSMKTTCIRSWSPKTSRTSRPATVWLPSNCQAGKVLVEALDDADELARAATLWTAWGLMSSREQPPECSASRPQHSAVASSPRCHAWPVRVDQL